MNKMEKISFIESIKVVPDLEKEQLLRIQNEIEKQGMSKEIIKELTQNLTDSQKERLKKLYCNQIAGIEKNIEMYKQKIIRIKSRLRKSKI